MYDAIQYRYHFRDLVYFGGAINTGRQLTHAKLYGLHDGWLRRTGTLILNGWIETGDITGYGIHIITNWGVTSVLRAWGREGGDGDAR